MLIGNTMATAVYGFFLGKLAAAVVWGFVISFF
jgi:hypothetical protein